MDYRAICATISTLSALLPIFMGSFAFKHHRLVRWFLLFLIYGFFTDVFNALSDESTNIIEKTTFTLIIQNLYSLVEAVFLFWFIAQMLNSNESKRYIYVLAILMIPLWIICSFVLKDTLINGQSLSNYFEPGYEMLLSLCAAFALLKITELGNRNPNHSLLWLLIGIFFSNFCLFFLHSFVNWEIADKIWFMGNLVNVITMIMYTYAFIKVRALRDNSFI